MLKIEDLTVGYGKRYLIEDANATMEDGRLIALIGRNGAGKSTLLRALAGQDRPITGRVLINGEDIETLPPHRLAQLVAFVTTERVRIPNMTCEDVVGLGRAPYTDWIGRLSAENKEIVMQSLRQVGMEDYAHRTMDKMSDGECQRIMIARALAQSTPVVMLDEPTSFLDMPNRYEMTLLLRELAHHDGRTIIFSTHELDIALNLCDDIALVDTPRLVYGPVAEVVAAGAIERLFRSSRVSFDPRTGTVKFKS